MQSLLKRLQKDTLGANMVEYIILVGVVALLAIGAFRGFKDKITTKVGNQGTAVEQQIQ
jgi:pilus assembly protein Flp/PilA